MAVTNTYDHFYRYEEITEIVKKYATQFPEYVRLTALNQTPEGRTIWGLEITDLSTGDYTDKPAYHIQANIHAGEVTGCMSAMYFLDYLFTNCKTDPEVIDLLKTYTIYMIPRVSMDGSECYLTTPEMIRSVNRMYPFEELMPGLQPKDIDGDGVIRKMRVKSPYGAWKISQDDDRVMTKRLPDDTDGDFYHVFQEGYIEQYDGLNIAPAPGKWGNDFNRNFPADWRPENEQKGSGKYPLSNIETKTSADFIIGHKNICSVIDFHTMTGAYLYPPGIKPREQADKTDMQRYLTIGKMATEETTYPPVNAFDEYMPAGSPLATGAVDDFCHFTLGIPAYTIECWDLDPRAGLPFVWPTPAKLSDEEQEHRHRQYLKWIDENLDGTEHDNACKAWTKFDHPQLGEVEIGGIDYKHVVQNPPLKFLPQEVEKHTRFLLRHIKSLPKVSFRTVEVEKVDASTYKIDAYVMNTGYLPTHVSNEALKLKVNQDLKVSLDGEDVSFILGKQTESIGQLEGFSGIKAENSTLGANTTITNPCEKKVSWMIQAACGTKLTITCQNRKIGKHRTTITL